MTTPRPETIEREKDKLYITDAELFRWLGVPRATLRPILIELENKHGFPKKQALFGGRRYKPTVKAWLDRYNGIPNEIETRVLRHAKWDRRWLAQN